MENYKECNAEQVLRKVERLIDLGGNYYIRNVYMDLSIFDWWKDTLSQSNLKDMRKFLKEAIKLGYTGYVCFKVGVTGCSNGMWAFKEESTDGYSPKGDAIYKSFTPAYNYWQVNKMGLWGPQGTAFDSITTIKELENYVGQLK